MSTHDSHDYEGHRCSGSLKSRCSIRRYPLDPGSLKPIYYRDGHWHMWALAYDSEWLVNYMSWVARIEYCPFCGKEL